MKNDWKQRCVWVTGASSGIGRALTLQLLAQGARVIASARRQDRLEALRAESGAGDRMLVLPMDVTDPDAREEALRQACAWQGGFDALVHNAGVGQNAPADATSMEVERRIMEVNYFAPVALTKLALPYLQQRKGAQLVVVSSVVAYLAPPTRSAYAASKHALHGFFNALRAEQACHDVAVSLVCPGWVASEFRKSALDGAGTQDPDATPRGISTERCAQAVCEALRTRRREVYVGGPEIWAIYAQRFVPGLVDWAFTRWAAQRG